MDIKDFSTDRLIRWFEAKRIRPFHARQTLRWIYQRQADSFEVMSDLSKDIRRRLSLEFQNQRLRLVRVLSSTDGTRKYLLGLADGHTIETVLIPEKDHYTLCISSQVGCAQGCRFCLTARSGFSRNLSQGEIISQVRDVQRRLPPDGMPLRNIVFMGMGEPLANYRQVLGALKLITDQDVGLRYSGRRLTLSTVGIVPAMTALGRESSVNLAVSLNATDNRTRSRLMPVNHRYPLETLLDACARFPLANRQRITFEYVLIRGVNDALDNARQLARQLAPIRAKINLIPFNPHPKSRLQRPDDATVTAFQDFLAQKHFTTMVRKSKGRDILAACGQLRAGHLDAVNDRGPSDECWG